MPHSAALKEPKVSPYGDISSFSCRCHRMRCTSQLKQLDIFSLSLFSLAFDIPTSSLFSLLLLLMLVVFIAKERIPFTLLSPSATFASFTNLSPDSSKAQAQSPIAGATLFKNWNIFLFLSFHHIIYSSSLSIILPRSSSETSSPYAKHQKFRHKNISKAIQQALSTTMMNNGTDNFEGGVPAGWVREFWLYVFVIWFSVNMIIIICLWPFRDWTELL